MGFIIFFFNHQKWLEIYRDNCSLMSTEKWNSYRDPHHTSIGILYLTIGIIFEILYIPFIIAIMKREFLQYSCYKFMLFLGFIDMIAVPADSIAGGIQSTLGLHYCSNPTFFYLLGCVSITCYTGATAICVCLALNRFFEIIFPNAAKIIYGKYMLVLWFCFPIGYILFFWFNSTTTFNVVYLANYIDPYLGVPGFQGNIAFYDGKAIRIYLVNSCLVFFGVGAPYVVLCIVMSIKTKLYPSQTLTKYQRIMFLQSLAICGELFMISTVYTFNQYFPIPDFMIKIEHLSWYCMHGDTPIVYLLLNSSLRKRFCQMIREYTKKSGKRIAYYATSVYSARITPNAPGFLTTEQNATPQLQDGEIRSEIPIPNP